jgi:hypothetical protein
MLWTIRTGEVGALGESPRDLVNLRLPLLASTATERDQIEEMIRLARPRRIVLSTCMSNPGDSGGPLVDERSHFIGVTFGIPSDPAESKFSYHVALSEVRSFLADASRDPILLVPEMWDIGPRVGLLNAQILVAGTETPGQFFLDLDADTPEAVIEQLDFRKLIGERRFDAEVALHFGMLQRIAFYDGDGDGQIELILVDDDEDGAADHRYERTKDGEWRVVDRESTWLDPDIIESRRLRSRFKDLLAALEKMGQE